MKRRTALKNMGMVFGYTVATPTLIGLAQSCKSKNTLDWTPSFFSKDKGNVLVHLIDIILPKTDTPSASEVNVHVFIDQFANEVMPIEQQDFINKAMDTFIGKVLTVSKKSEISNIDSEDLVPILTPYLKKREDTLEEEHNIALENYFKSIENDETHININDDVLCFEFANSIRNLSIWSYKTSEYVGEEVLAYLPVPGTYVGCGDLNEMTGGKAWSL